MLRFAREKERIRRFEPDLAVTIGKLRADSVAAPKKKYGPRGLVGDKLLGIANSSRVLD